MVEEPKKDKKMNKEKKSIDNNFNWKKYEKEILKDLINNESINRLYSILILWSLSIDKTVKLEWTNSEDIFEIILNKKEWLFVFIFFLSHFFFEWRNKERLIISIIFFYSFRLIND